MENLQLLCSFAKKRNVDETILEIRNAYESVSKIFVLEDTNGGPELFCTYNVLAEELKKKLFLKSTISVHRNKSTNTLYTINAVNTLVLLLNDGNKDSTFKISWENYKNMLIVTNEIGLKKINTKLFKIVTF